MAFPAEFSVTNPAGGKTSIVVSSLDKKKLEQFRTELQSRVFADNDQLRHDDAQAVRMQQLMIQQMQLQQQMGQNNNTPQQ